MKKKLLEKIQPKAKTIDKQYKHKWLVTAEEVKVLEDNVLIVNFYENKYLIKGNSYLPKYRLFMTLKEDEMQNIDTNEWCTMKIDNMPGGCYSINDSFEVLDQTSTDIINKFTPRGWSSNPMSKIENHQCTIRRNKSNRTYTLRVERINKANEIINKIKIPKDFEKFINDNAFADKRYIFYQAEKNKRYITQTCSHCMTTTRIDTKNHERPRHNGEGKCPKCKSKIIFKVIGRQEKLNDKVKVILMQKLDQGFVSRYFEAYKTSVADGENIRYHEEARVVYTGERIMEYYNIGSYVDNTGWWDKNGDSYGNHILFGEGVLYSKNLNEVLDNTTFKYCAIKILADHQKGYNIHHCAFLRRYESHRYIEYFIKMGLFNLANDYVRYSGSSKIDAKGKNVLEILKLQKQQINRLIELDGNLYTLGLLQLEQIEGKRFTDEQIKFMTDNDINLDSLNVLAKYATVGKALRYLRENSKNNSVNNMIRDWLDYIENCKTLKYDLKNEFILFPRNLKQSHDNVTTIILNKKNKSKDKLFKAVAAKNKKEYAYETKTFAIVVPGKTEELVKEGQELHHCVGTYVDRVIESKTSILFIRRKEELEKSFYTMEVHQGNVIQVRGKNNCDMTPPVKQFVESFKAKKLQYQPEREAV